MSATKQLLDILEKGPESAEGLAAITGMDLARVRDVLAHMKDYGYLETRPATFVVTPKGKQRSMEAAKPPLPASQKRQERKKARQAGITAEAAKAARMRDALVSKSIRNRPALEQVWGAMA